MKMPQYFDSVYWFYRVKATTLDLEPAQGRFCLRFLEPTYLHFSSWSLDDPKGVHALKSTKLRSLVCLKPSYGNWILGVVFLECGKGNWSLSLVQ